MKPICLKCARFFRPVENGFYFIEGMPKGLPLPGMAQPNMWTPYKLWAGDLWTCEGCDAYIVVGTGRTPVAEHFEENFAHKLKLLNAKFQVNDC